MEATATANAASNGGKFACDVCSKTFDSTHALGGHKSAAHRTRVEDGARRVRADRVRVDEDVEDNVDILIKATVKPLREERERLAERVEVLQHEVNGLRAKLARLDKALRFIDPTFAPAPKSPTKAAAAQKLATQGDQVKIDAVLAFFETHVDEFADGVTASRLIDRMREENARPRPGPSKMPMIMQALRDRGVIYADRIATGGGMIWKLVGQS